MPDVDDLYNSDEEQQRLAEIMEARYRAMARAVNAAVIRMFGLEAERFRLRDSDVNLLLVDAAERVVRITETERQAIAEQLRLGQEFGLSNWEIANGKPEIGYRGVDGLYQETWKGRAETIARTELQHAQNEAAMNRYMATGLVEKVQIVDGDEDAPCASRNGRVVPISERPRLAHPNCTLGLIPVLREGVA